MIAENPQWSFRVRHNLTKWYGHVQLTPTRAVGQWFAIDRQTGQCLWEKRFWRANNVVQLVGGIILADETRSDGPWTMGFGCYAIEESSGKLLWQWHGRGVWGHLVRALDWVPGFTNELRPTVIGVRGSECIVSSGWVLDLQTGRPLRKERDFEPWKKPPWPQTPAEILYAKKAMEIAPGLTLATYSPKKDASRPSRPEGALDVRLTGADGATVWQWGPYQLGLHGKTNYYGWRLLGSRILFICGEEPEHLPHPTKKHYAVNNPTAYHLVVIDTFTGGLIQRLPVTDGKVRECRIEDVDEHGVLISEDGKRLSYYPMGD